jgi:hypothetical protein
MMMSISAVSKPVASRSKFRSVVESSRNSDRQQIKVPAGVLGNAIVGKHQCRLLSVRQSVHFNNWNLNESQLLRRGQAAVAGNHHTRPIDQQRIVKPKRLDTRSDLMDLLFWMRSGIARIGLDLIDKLHDQLHKRLLLPLWLHADASGAAVFLMFDWGWSAQIRRRLLLATDNERPLALASLRRALPHRSGGHCPQI